VSETAAILGVSSDRVERLSELVNSLPARKTTPRKVVRKESVTDAGHGTAKTATSVGSKKRS
jgi:hypothetical protein